MSALEQRRQNLIEIDPGFANMFRVLGGVATGTNTYSVTLSQGFIEGYYDGLQLSITFSNANTGPSTLSVNGITAAEITDNKGEPLGAGVIEAGGLYSLYYDGTQFKISTATGTVSLKSFGAIGDGTTHPLSEFYGSLAEAQVDFPLATDLSSEIDKEAFKKAVDEAASNSEILFPQGNYLIDTVILSKSVNIRGAGAIVTNPSASYTWFYGSGIDDCFLTGIRFIGTSGSSGNRGIVFNQAKNYVVDRCVFKDFNQEAIECRSTHQSNGTADKVGGQIEASIFVENGIGIQFANRGEYNNVVNCNFDNNTVALEIEGGNNAISGSNLSFNTDAIHIIDGTNEGKNIFVGNNINHNDRPVFIEDCSTGNDFIGNHIITGTATNIHIRNSNNVRFIGGQIDVENYFFENCNDVEFVDVLFNDSDANTINDNYNTTTSDVTWTKCRVKDKSRISSPAGSYNQTTLNDVTSRSEEIIRATGTSTITLLDASLVPEKEIKVINIGVGTITIADGGGTLATNSVQDSVTTLISAEGSWYVV